MSKNKKIISNNYLDKLNQSAIKKDRFKSDLIHAIEEGVNSGLIEDFNPEEHLKMLKAKRKMKL